MPTPELTIQDLTYEKLTKEQLDAEFIKIVKIPNARTNVEALTKMSALMTEYEKRGIQLPSERIKKAKERSQNNTTLIIGVILLVGGIALTASSHRIFYGAIIVGLGMIIKGIIGTGSRDIDY